MTNRELLELAAKAAGIEIEWNVMINHNSPILATKTQQERNWLGHEHTPWNPLSDDGDALRLAVKLELDLYNSCISVRAIHRDRDTGTSIKCRGSNPRMDPNAATRFAIVRAAAEIGKSMEVKL